MLSDRSYMRDDESAGRTSVLTWLLCAITAGFLLQNVVTLLLGMGPLMQELFGLSLPSLHQGSHPFLAIAGSAARLVTYAFVYDLRLSILGVLCIGITLYFLGREVLPIVGAKRFLGLFFAFQIAGGIGWSAVHWTHPSLLLGAAPAVAGLLAIFALYAPDRDMTIFLLFVPVTVKPKHVAWVVIAIDLFCCVFYEVLGNTPPISLAPSAHLGAMAFGWIYWKFLHERSWGAKHRSAIELPKWIKRAPPGSPKPPVFQVNLNSREHLKAEVDRILDKINSQGFGALTAEEKRRLDEAKDLLSRH